MRTFILVVAYAVMAWSSPVLAQRQSPEPIPAVLAKPWPPKFMHGLPADRLDRAWSGIIQAHGSLSALKCSDAECSDLPAHCQATGVRSDNNYCLFRWSTGGIGAFMLDRDASMVNRYFASAKCCGDFNPASPSGIGAWATMQLRFYGLFNLESGLVPGKLEAKGQANIELAMWGILNKFAKVSHAKLSPQVYWNGSQNRYVPSAVGYLLISQWLRHKPSFSSRRLSDGSTIEAQYQAWHAWISKFLDRRIKSGLWTEVGIGYEDATVDSIVNVRDFSEDAVLRKKAEMLLDLHFANVAEETLLNTRGGPKSRVKGNQPYDSTFRSHRAYNLLFGLWDGSNPRSVPHSAFSTSNYLPPLPVERLAQDSEARGSYVFAKRWPDPGVMSDGTARDDEGNVIPPKWFAFDPVQTVLRYGFVGSNFVLGSAGRGPSWWEGWDATRNSGPRGGPGFLWQGVTFKATPGKPETQDARIGFEVEPSCMGNTWHAFEPFAALQYRNVLITQRWVPTSVAQGNNDIRPNSSKCNPSFLKIYFSQALDAVIDGGNGWIFARSGRAFAAVKIAAGSYKWVGPTGEPTTWSHRAQRAGSIDLRNLKFALMDTNAPAILIVNDASDYGDDFSKFQSAIRQQDVQYDTATGAIQFSNLTFYGPSKLGKISGRTLNLTPDLLNDSPFIRSVWNSGLVCIRKGGDAVILDVRDSRHPAKEVIGSPPYPVFCPSGLGQDSPVIF